MPDAHAILANSVDRLLARFGKDCELLHSIPGTSTRKRAALVKAKK